MTTLPRTSLLCLLVSFSVMTAFTQNIEHTCFVVVLEENIETESGAKKDLGEFTVSFDSKNPLNVLTKTFQIPETKMFVSTSVHYGVESGSLKSSPPDQMLTTLILGKKVSKMDWETLMIINQQ